MPSYGSWTDDGTSGHRRGRTDRPLFARWNATWSRPLAPLPRLRDESWSMNTQTGLSLGNWGRDWSADRWRRHHNRIDHQSLWSSRKYPCFSKRPDWTLKLQCREQSVVDDQFNVDQSETRSRPEPFQQYRGSHFGLNGLTRSQTEVRGDVLTISSGHACVNDLYEIRNRLTILVVRLAGNFGWLLDYAEPRKLSFLHRSGKVACVRPRRGGLIPGCPATGPRPQRGKWHIGTGWRLTAERPECNVLSSCSPVPPLATSVAVIVVPVCTARAARPEPAPDWTACATPVTSRRRVSCVADTLSLVNRVADTNGLVGIESHEVHGHSRHASAV